MWSVSKQTVRWKVNHSLQTSDFVEAKERDEKSSKNKKSMTKHWLIIVRDKEASLSVLLKLLGSFQPP